MLGKAFAKEFLPVEFLGEADLFLPPSELVARTTVEPEISLTGEKSLAIHDQPGQGRGVDLFQPVGELAEGVEFEAVEPPVSF